MRIRRAVTRTRAVSTIPAAPNTPGAVKARRPSAPPSARNQRIGSSSESSPVIPRCSSPGGCPPDQRTGLASSSRITREAPRGGGWTQTIASYRSSGAACRQLVSDSNASLAGPSLPVKHSRAMPRVTPGAPSGVSNIVRKPVGQPFMRSSGRSGPSPDPDVVCQHTSVQPERAASADTCEQ